MRATLFFWQDNAGLVHGCFVDNPEICAAGESARDVRQELQDHLKTHLKEFDEACLDDVLSQTQLHQFAVKVYPEYWVNERLYPAAQPLSLIVPCVSGVDASGQNLAVLPLFQRFLSFHSETQLKQLVQHYVQQSLREKSPGQLAPFLLDPEHFLLAEMNLRQKTQSVDGSPLKAQHLKSVAQPLCSRGMGAVWERQQEILELKTLLEQGGNLLLIGADGVGKTSVLAAAAQAIEGPNPKVPRFWLSSGGRLISGQMYLGQWQARCSQIVEELADIQGVLCLESLRELLELGGRTPDQSLAAYWAGYLRFNEVRMLVECSPEDYLWCQKQLPGFLGHFRQFRLNELGRGASLRVLRQLGQNLQQSLNLEIEEAVYHQMLSLFQRFMPYRSRPGALVQHLQQWARSAEILDLNQYHRFFTRQTGLPEKLFKDEQRLTYAEVFEGFAQEVLAQPAACHAATQRVLSFKAGLNDPQRPLGVLCFAGPTGVGKTALARALARQFFSGEARLLRLDMSEYSGAFAVERFAMNPDGSPASWLEKMRQQPFQLVLFDEIEKADPAIFDLLMTLFDEGRFTDNLGRVTHFQSALIVMTTNLGAAKGPTPGFHAGAAPGPRASKAVQAYFRPEFFNRLDEVIDFLPLEAESIAQIAAKELKALSQREGLQRAQVHLDWDDSLIQHLVGAGYDLRYGARPLLRVLERDVLVPLSQRLNSGFIPQGARLHLSWMAACLEIQTIT